MNFEYVRAETVNRHASAARSGDLQLLQDLVGADEEGARSTDNRGWTPVHEAAVNGHSAIIRYLSSVPGVNMNAATWEGETPLFLACKHLPQTKQAVHTLLKLRVRVNIATNEECTPLQFAAVKGEVEVVKWLVRKGALVNKANVWKETPLHCALKRPNVEPGTRLAIVKYLVKHGANVDVQDENNLSLVMLAGQKGLEEMCLYLLEEDPSMVNARAEDGATALMLGCHAGEVGVVNALLGAGADLDLAADDGTMALHLAASAKKNSAEILERILPLTTISKVYSQPQEERRCCGSLVSNREECKVLSPFHLALDWDNYQAIEVLCGYLDPSRFHIPIEECPVHSEYCTQFQEGECPLFKCTRKNPLAHLLSSPNLPHNILRLIELLETNIQDPHSIPPLLSLFIGGRRVNGRLFQEGDLHRTILRRLLDKGGQLVEADHLPIILLSHVSGVWALVQEGTVAPSLLVSTRILADIRNIINQGFSRRLLNTEFSVPLLSPRLLAVAHLASECGILELDYLRELHDVLWFQLTELQISRVELLEDLYATLKKPKSLQVLCRKSIHAALQELPRTGVPRLGLPEQIRAFLLFKDVEIEGIVRAYRSTWDRIHAHISNV